jgi:hypothetical protein
MPMLDVRWAMGFPTFLSTCPAGSVYFADWRYGVGESREALYHTAINGVPDITHMLFLDADIIPNANVVKLLLEDNKPVVSAIYFNSLLTGLNAWKEEKALDPKMAYTDPLVEVDKVGMGCCLMNKKVFDVLAEETRPLFFYKIDTITNQMLSEDFWFFKEKLLKYGIKPWVDLRAQCVHLKSFGVNPDGSIGAQAPKQ